MSECRVPNCPKPQQALGVCVEHLAVITKQVNAGQVTWKQYQEAGICLPPPEPTNHDMCLTNGCVTKPRSRGLCDNCYASAVRTMKKENLQWPDLEQLGLSRPMRRRSFIKQSLFQEAARLAIAEKVIKDKISFGTSIEPAAPEQTVPVTQSEPLLSLPPIQRIDPHIMENANNQATLKTGTNGIQLPPHEFDGTVNVPPSVSPPSSLVVGQQDVAPAVVPVVPEPVSPPPAVPAPALIQVPAIPLEPLEPDSRDVSAVEMNLSRINAPDPELTPEQELDAALPTNFSPPPTQFPGQEGGV